MPPKTPSKRLFAASVTDGTLTGTPVNDREPLWATVERVLEPMSPLERLQFVAHLEQRARLRKDELQALALKQWRERQEALPKKR